MKDDPDALRARIEQLKVGERIPENVWQGLLESGAVAKVLAGEKPEDWLTELVFRLAPSLLRTKADPMLSGRQLGEREEFLSQFLAGQAAADDEIRRFRREALDDHLLATEQVSEWISAHQDDPTAWIEVPLPAESSYTISKGGIIVNPSFTIGTVRSGRIHRRLLEYVHPDGWVRRVPTGPGTLLERLRRLSEDLNARYGWQLAQATNFVLTGATPLLRAIKTETTRAGRLVLDVDPGVSPAQLIAAYRKLRRDLFGGRRARALTENQQRIAAFLSTRPVAESWADRRRAWNRAHPREVYPSNRAQNFKRACEQVIQRLLNPIDKNTGVGLTKDEAPTKTRQLTKERRQRRITRRK